MYGEHKHNWQRAALEILLFLQAGNRPPMFYPFFRRVLPPKKENKRNYSEALAVLPLHPGLLSKVEGNRGHEYLQIYFARLRLRIL